MPNPLVNRIKLFIDFWNFELSCKEFGTDVNQYKINWKKLPDILCKQVQTQLVSNQNFNLGYAFEGAHVYISYGPKDDKLRRWAEEHLSAFPGYTVVGADRVAKSSQKCQQCKRFITACPHCQVLLQGTIEKGVDTKLAVDMIGHAWDDHYDTAVIVSSDRDFIPAVEMLGRRGKKIFQAGVPSQGKELATACWDSIDLSQVQDKLRRENT